MRRFHQNWLLKIRPGVSCPVCPMPRPSAAGRPLPRRGRVGRGPSPNPLAGRGAPRLACPGGTPTPRAEGRQVADGSRPTDPAARSLLRLPGSLAPRSGRVLTACGAARPGRSAAFRARVPGARPRRRPGVTCAHDDPRQRLVAGVRRRQARRQLAELLRHQLGHGVREFLKDTSTGAFGGLSGWAKRRAFP